MRSQRVILFVAVVGATARSLVACSDDKPAAGTTSSSSGGPIGSGADASDAAHPPDASDAAPEAGDDGGCLADQPVQGGGVPACSGSCATYCNDVAANYRLGLAQVAVSCIAKLSSCSDPLAVNLCVDNAVARACKDPSSPGYCSPLVTACDPNAGGPGSVIDEPSCEGLANALSPSGRNTFAGCVQSKIDGGNCPSDVRLCTDALRQ